MPIIAVTDNKSATDKAKEPVLDNRTLTSFIAQIQRRAFRMAELSVGNSDDALDIVQDAMTKLIQRYADKSWEEWRPLFYRILHNKINDFHRRRGVHNRFRVWLSPFTNKDGEEENSNPYEAFPAHDSNEPDQQLAQQQRLQRLSVALRQLPARQREAFTLRCWEGLSTAETALAMQCSEGSVKTHYSRALTFVRKQLEEVAK